MKIVVIGAGPAGESAARLAAKQKAEVTLIEKGEVGGLCLNRGCIPSKTLLSFGKRLADYRHFLSPKIFSGAKKIAIEKEIWQEIKKEKNQVIQKLRGQIEQSIKLHKIQMINGMARFSSLKQITVALNSGEKILDFDKAIVAAGSAPIFPSPLDSRQKDLLDSDKIFELENVPESLLIVGGGAVGCEFACLFNELGSKITILEKKVNLLPGEDALVVNTLRKSFEKRGIQIFDSVTVQELKEEGNRWQVTLSNQKSISVEQILVCVGRKPHLKPLGLENAGIQTSAKGIEIDSHLRTSNANIYAVGDVNGLSLLAHAGSVQGEIAALNALGGSKIYDGRFVPRCLYTWPEIASVGLWNYEAENLGLEIKSQRFFFESSGKALAEGETEGFIQILWEKNSGKILGGQMIGAHATELIHIISVALHQNMTRETLSEVIFAHPTLSEGIKIALNK